MFSKKSLILFLFLSFLSIANVILVQGAYVNTQLINDLNQLRSNSQCIHGGVQSVVTERYYLNDIVYPWEEFVPDNSTNNNYFYKFLFSGNPQSVFTMNGLGYNSLSQFGNPFVIKSEGHPLRTGSVNVSSVDVARDDDGIRFTNHAPSTLNIGAQLVYDLYAQAYYTPYGNNSVGAFTYKLPGSNTVYTAGPYSQTYTNSTGYITHGYECVNYYISRCGDGYIDANGVSTRPGYIDHPISLANTSIANEVCDPGLTGVPSDDVFATAQPNGTTCSQTCTIILPQATQYVNPVIVKSQRNITRNTPTTGQYTAGPINYSSGNQIEYRVVISNPSTTLSTYTGISLREQLPSNFVYAITNPVTIVTGGVVTPAAVTYSTTTHQSSAFQLAPLASVTFFIRGTLLTNSPTTRTNIANLYVGNIEIDDSDVSMNYNIPLAPSLSIVKSQRIRPGATNYIMSGSLPNGPAFVTTPLTGNIGDMIDYRIRVTNTGAGTAYLSTIVDNAINASIPGLNCPVIAVSNMYHIASLPLITSSVYKVPNQALWAFNPAVVLQTNHEVNIYFSCAIIATRPTYSNHGSATWSTGGAMTTTLSNTVIVTTPTPPLPSITLNKEIKTGAMANYGQYEDGHNGALVVNSGDVVSYRITITKTGGPIQPIRLSDIWPSCFTPNDATIGNLNISPSLLVTGYLLSQFNTSGSVTVVITIDGIVTPTGSCGIERNTAFLSLPVGYPYTIIDPWGNQSGISTIVPIRDTADFQLAGYAPHSNLWLEKTVSPPYTSSHNHNLTLQAGSTFRFTLRFGNTGNVTATGVVITDTLPTGLICTSYFINGHGPTPFSGSIFSYNYGALLPGATGEISLVCIVPLSVTGSFFLNTGYLLYNNITLNDTASITLTSNPGFTILKTVNTGVIFSGQTLTYTIHFTNTGSQLSSYYIFDPLSPALTYVPNSATLNGLPRAPLQSGNILFWGCNAGSSGTNLNSTSVCPLVSGGSGTIVFQALVH